MNYEVKITDEIKAIYRPSKADGWGTSDTMEIDFFIVNIEVTQPDLDAALRMQYEHELWLDLKARQEEAVLDRFINEKVLEPNEWLWGDK